MTCRAATSIAVAILCLLGWPAAAQDHGAAPRDYPVPAHVSFVDGAVVLERDGQLDRAPRSMPLLTGDRIRTETGRAEVLFPDSSALHLDAGTIVDFQSDEVVRLLRGRLRLAIAGPARDLYYRIDAPSAWIEIHEVGEYRVTVPSEGDVELAVLRGSAELVNELGRTHIRAGEQTFARAGAAPSQPYVFNSAAWDGFDRWSEGRRTERLGRSAQYLPPDVRPYAATFDAYGTWRHDPAYGYVWYPRVAVGWRPYHRGRWVTLRPYGWTWIAGDPWGWPTHHFGRWGFSAGAWFWIPGRHWGPAWVAWAYTPHYVSWCPLGWNNRPVVQIVNVNIGVGRRFSPWDAWTVVPRRHFTGTFVNVAAIGSVRIDQRVQNTFVVRDRAPEARFAVSRDAAPIRSAGRLAVPRSGSGSAAVSRSADTGRRLASPGTARSSAERRFPAPARTPGSAVGTRGADDTSPAPGARAVARDGGGVASPGGTWRNRAAPGSAAGGRAVTHEPDRGAPANPARTRATAPRSEHPAPGAPARSTDQPDRRRDGAASAPARAPESAPPAGAVRAVPRARTSTAQPASRIGREAAAAQASPGRTGSSPAPVAAAPARRATTAPAAAAAPQAAQPASRPGFVRSPSTAEVSRPTVTRPRIADPAPSRTRTDATPARGRATSRGTPAPPPAPQAPRVTPQRRAPATTTVQPSSARPPADRGGASAGAASRQRSAEASSSGQRGRRRE